MIASNNKKRKHAGHAKRKHFNDKEIISNINIMSINMQGIYSDKDTRNKLNNYLELYDIDICMIQEWYLHDRDVNAEFLNIDFTNYNARYNNNKTLILINKQLSEIKINVENIDNEYMHTSWCAIKSKSNVFAFCSFYHSPSDAEPPCLDPLSYQVCKVRKQLSKYNNIYFNIGGDFNAKNELWGSRGNDNRGEEIMDWNAENDFVFINDGSHTHINRTTGITDALDLSLISTNTLEFIKNWRVDNKLFKDHNSTDHFALIYEINCEIEVEKEVIKTTWNFDENKDNEYKKIVKEYLKKWFIIFNKYKNDKKYINILTKKFQDCITSAAEKVYGLKKYSNRSRPGMSREIRKLIKNKYNIMYEIFKIKNKLKYKKFDIKNGKTFMLKNELKNLNHKKNKLVKKIFKKRSKLLEKSSKLIEERINDPKNNNEKEMHKLYRDANGKKNENNIKLLRDDNSKEIIATTKQEIVDKLQIHFNNPIKRNKYNLIATNYHKKVNKFMCNYKFNHNQSNNIINRPFTSQEVLNRINNLNTSSAQAWDFIHYKLIHIARFIIHIYLTALLNVLYTLHQLVPIYWLHSEYVPAIKPGRDPEYCGNIRPLQIIPGLMRIIMGLLGDRLLYDTIKRCNIRISNTAFQRNRSTEDIYLGLTEKIYRAIENGHFLEVGFMDLKSAYDSVWIDNLLYKLIKIYGYDGNIIAWLSYYFRNRWNRTKMDNIRSPWSHALENLPQGDPMSTILFCVYLNDYDNLSSTEKNSNEGKLNVRNIELKYDISLNNFADDCTLEMPALMHKCNLNNNIKFNLRYALQEEMKHFYQFTLNNKLVLKNIKCNTITFSRKNRNFSAYVYKLNNHKLDLIHHIDHSPKICKHHARQQYLNQKMNDELNNEDNGDSDLENLDNNGNKININNHSNSNYYNYNLLNKQNKDKWKNVQENHIHKLPESVRILGVHFDPKLTLNKHIEITLNRVKKDMYKLIRIAHCKLYQLNAHTMWKLYTSVIRPKLEYALCTISSASYFEKFNQLQLKIAKIALRVHKRTPTVYVKHLLNIKTVQQRLEEMQIKLWNKYIRSPPHLMQHHTFKKWKQYIINNGGNINLNKQVRSNNYNIKENFNINSANFKYISKSPLSRTYKLIDKLLPIHQRRFYRREYSVLRPPPIYSQPFPTNINVIDGQELNNCDVNDFMENTIKIYTDGSCRPNPGPGGSAFYAPAFPPWHTNRCEQVRKCLAINHDTTINYAELKSIEMVCNYILEYTIYHAQKDYYYFKDFSIFTDSNFVKIMLSIDGYPKYDYYYKLMERIINLINLLDNYNINLNIIKIRSHQNIDGNEEADRLAKIASQQAKDAKFNKKNNWYNLYYNPIMVDNTKLNKLLNDKYKNIHRKEWKDRLEIWKDEDTKIFKNNTQLFDNIMFYGPNIIASRTNKLKNELKYLKPIECEIINKIRTEHINLNNFKKFYFNETEGICNICKCREDVSHYILDCPINEELENYMFSLRNKLWSDLKRLHIFYKNPANRNVTNLVFPHEWMFDPKRDDPRYWYKCKRNLNLRVKILKRISKFVLDSKRFENEKYKFG